MDEPIFTSARSFRSTRNCTNFSSIGSFGFTRNSPSSSSADHPRNPSWAWTKPCSNSGDQKWGKCKYLHFHFPLINHP
jgi:hypothetical protein